MNPSVFTLGFDTWRPLYTIPPRPRVSRPNPKRAAQANAKRARKITKRSK